MTKWDDIMRKAQLKRQRKGRKRLKALEADIMRKAQLKRRQDLKALKADMVEAVRDELLVERYARSFSDRLGKVMDVEAGLAQILLTPLTPAALEPSMEPLERGALNIIGLTDPRERLLVRNLPTVIHADGVLQRVLRLVGTVDQSQATRLDEDLGTDFRSPQARRRAEIIERHLEYVLARIREFCSETGSVVEKVGRQYGDGLVLSSSVRDRLREFDYAVVCARSAVLRWLADPEAVHRPKTDRSPVAAIDHAYLRAEDLVATCVMEARKTMARHLDRDIPLATAEAVTAFLHDFTSTDLSGTDLRGIDLAGVRWSEFGTSWPENVDVDGIRSQSEETPPGSWTYVIRSGSATVRDFATI
ncbi:hypothetical protein [Kitasatospora sp. NPDC048407]|uniref:hypothetical protein n=1 Tax=Kitasatospora sp. NPDC048407 TaxID=3364051 RepID=UPI003719121A